MMSIGQKSERIAIERKARVQRADKGYDTTVSTVASRWARIRPLTANEQEEAGRQAGITQYSVLVANLTDVVPSDTLVWVTKGNLRLNIKQVRAARVKEFDIELICESGAVL